QKKPQNSPKIPQIFPNFPKNPKFAQNSRIFWQFQIQPDLRELMETMTRMSSLPPDFEGRQKVNLWLQTLSAMSASDELDDSQVRQMLFDLESAYNAFNRFLHS
ncbi:vacuolar protein sorting-associated protein 28 homolog, partial [Agelaius phoeniceus]|uniref:vacuolar protein sorting-associated protein 28 homolog n=1 Tax=Agelaius phoeniceus TaxID=39638 RepID=UPI004055083F